MSKIRRLIGIKATKAVASHSARGLSAKVQRRPLRSVSLVSAGVFVGLAAGWAAARANATQS